MPPLPRTAAGLLLAAAVAVAAPSARAQRPGRPLPTAVLVGTVLEEQSDAPRCGGLAVAVWARVRVERVIAGRIPVGSQVRIVVGCPGSTVVGRTYRFVVDAVPRAEHWDIYTLWGELPRDGLPTFYWRSFREVGGTTPQR